MFGGSVIFSTLNCGTGWLIYFHTRLAAYSLVTPIGISTGIGVRNTFTPNDPSTILVIGILDSLSAGVLMYGALVNLLAKDFLAGEMLDVSNRRLCVALASLFVGAALMSLREYCTLFVSFLFRSEKHNLILTSVLLYTFSLVHQLDNGRSSSSLSWVQTRLKQG
jgi:hypothetical protein